MNGRPAMWLVVGAGLGAVLRNLAATSATGTSALIANGAITAGAGLLAGLTIGLRRFSGAAFVLGVAAGAASAGLYAVLALTADLWVGLGYLITVPLVMAATFTAGVILVARVRPDRGEVAT